MRLLLLHGWGGSNFPHWQSWLASEIVKEYGCVNFVKLPNFDHPKLESWIKYASKEIKDFHPDIVVCHSLGNTLWFHLCNETLIKEEVKHLLLVAPPSLECEIKELADFFPVEVPKKLYAKNAMLIASDNDPYMDIQEARALQHLLNIPIEILHNAGHINAQSGYGQWQWILQYIKRVGQNE